MMNRHKPIRIGYIGFCLIGGSRYNSMITYYTTCSCKKLKFMMKTNGRVDRQKLANFKVIFDLFIFCFYFIQ